MGSKPLKGKMISVTRLVFLFSLAACIIAVHVKAGLPRCTQPTDTAIHNVATIPTCRKCDSIAQRLKSMALQLPNMLEMSRSLSALFETRPEHKVIYQFQLSMPSRLRKVLKV